MKRQPIPSAPAKTLFAQMTFVSASNADEQHRTQIFTDGSSHCTCEGHRWNKDCRHVKALRRPYSAQEFAGGFVIALELS